MTADDRKRDLIEQAAKAIDPGAWHGGVAHDPRWAGESEHRRIAARRQAADAFAVFEAAQNPADHHVDHHEDEREALAAHDAQVRAEERERAAVIADRYATAPGRNKASVESIAARDVAARIRDAKHPASPLEGHESNG